MEMDWIGRKKVFVPDLNKLYAYLKGKNLQDEFEYFLLDGGKKDLGRWLQDHQIKKDDYKKWLKYQMDCGDATFEKGQTLQIMQCIKDAYGKPYVPGSSIKGMLRTVLLSYMLMSDPDRYQSLKRKILETARNSTAKRNYYLQRETKELESEVFHKLHFSKNQADIVNDYMSGFIVSDSKPLSMDDLMLCQKVEYHVDGQCKKLNLLRECIKPNTVIDFTITIDSTKCPLDIADINQAVRDFSGMYYQFFSSKFANIRRPEANTVWLGGGAGYVSKTISYPLFQELGTRQIQTIFMHTGVPRMHKHDRDDKLGVSPHILKTTIYNGKLYQFGECRIEIGGTRVN